MIRAVLAWGLVVFSTSHTSVNEHPQAPSAAAIRHQAEVPGIEPDSEDTLFDVGSSAMPELPVLESAILLSRLWAARNPVRRLFLSAVPSMGHSNRSKLLEALTKQGYFGWQITEDGDPSGASTAQVLHVRGRMKWTHRMNGSLTAALSAMPDRPLTFSRLPPEPMTFYDKIRKRNIMFPVLGLVLMAGGSGAEAELLALQLHTIWVQFLAFDQPLDGGCQRWLASLGYRELRPTVWSRSAIAYTADGALGKADLGWAYAELDSTYGATLRSRAQQTARKTQETHLALSSRAKDIMAETARGSLGVPKTRRGVLLMSWRDVINENAGCTPRDFKGFMGDLRGPKFADGINPSGSKLPNDILRFLYTESDEWETEAMFSGCQMHVWMWWSRCFGLDIIVFDHGVSADDLPEFHLPVPLWTSGMARDLLSAAFRAGEAKGDDYTMSRMQRDYGTAGDLMTERTIAMLSDEVESYFASNRISVGTCCPPRHIYWARVISKRDFGS